MNKCVLDNIVYNSTANDQHSEEFDEAGVDEWMTMEK